MVERGNRTTKGGVAANWVEQLRSYDEVMSLYCVAGTGHPVLGCTKDGLADSIFTLLCKASCGVRVLFVGAPVQDGAWLLKRFVKSLTHAGEKSWKHLEKYLQQLELF